MRKTYLDNIKWITVVLVVIYHVIYAFNGVTTYPVLGPFGDKQPQDVYQYIVYPWFMLLLFVVSGMSARYDLNKRTDKAFLKARTTRYLVPSTIGLFVGGWVLGYYNMLVGGAFETMGEVPKAIVFLIMCFSGSGTLWFIQMLWIFSWLLVLVRKIDKDRLYNLGAKTNIVVLLLLTALIYGSAQVLNLPIVVYRFGIYGVGFFVGYFMLSHDEVMERLSKWWVYLVIAAIGLCVAFVIIYRGQPYSDYIVLNTLLCNVYAWIATLAILAFMKKWGNKSNTFTMWMCKKSWGLYVCHYLPLIMAGYYMKKYIPNLPPILMYILTGIAGFAGAYLLYEILSRIPFIRWALLGLKKEKKA